MAAGGTPASISQALFNEIRNAADANYQARIPQATRDNIAALGMALQTYSAQYNEFVAALINRIGMTIIRQTEFANPLAQFKRGALPMGQDVQEIFIEPLKSEGAYNAAGPNPLGRRTIDNTSAAYHRLDRKDYYVVSVDRTAFMRCFTSWERVDEYIRKLINSMYVGAAWDEYLCARQIMINAANSSAQGKTLARAYLGEILPKDDASGKAFVQALKYLVGDMRYLRNDYNQAGVLNRCRPEDLVLFVNKDIAPNIDVYTLAGLFNMDKAAYPTRVFPIDTFGGNNVIGILADKNWLQMYDVLVTTEPQRNAQGLFENIFLHVWQTLSVSPFANAVVLMSGNKPTASQQSLMSVRMDADEIGEKVTLDASTEKLSD